MKGEQCDVGVIMHVSHKTYINVTLKKKLLFIIIYTFSTRVMWLQHPLCVLLQGAWLIWLDLLNRQKKSLEN